MLSLLKAEGKEKDWVMRTEDWGFLILDCIRGEQRAERSDIDNPNEHNDQNDQNLK